MWAKFLYAPVADFTQTVMNTLVPGKAGYVSGIYFLIFFNKSRVSVQLWFNAATI
jgi:hypothetical protein